MGIIYIIIIIVADYILPTRITNIAVIHLEGQIQIQARYDLLYSILLARYPAR